MSIVPADVQAIYGKSSGLPDATIQVSIDTAVTVATELLVDTDYSDDLTDTILKYLAAHYLAIGFDQGGIVREKVGESEARYRDFSVDTTGLSTTLFGQQALALDFKGALSVMSAAPIKASFRVV